MGFLKKAEKKKKLKWGQQCVAVWYPPIFYEDAVRLRASAGGSVTSPGPQSSRCSTASMAQKGVTEPLFSMAGLFFLFVQCASMSAFIGRKT